jgi:hypothetical protein
MFNTVDEIKKAGSTAEGEVIRTALKEFHR